MKKHNCCKVLISFFLICFMICLSSCKSSEEREYYSRKSNYINAVGTVTHISYNEDNTALYFGLSELVPQFDDDNFKITGDNLLIVQERGIDRKIKIGDKIRFITAPKYFGDGYVMPIVALSVNEEELLGFEDGFANLMKWLN